MGSSIRFARAGLDIEKDCLRTARTLGRRRIRTSRQKRPGEVGTFIVAILLGYDTKTPNLFDQYTLW